jgi:hypothetical protein
MNGILACLAGGGGQDAAERFEMIALLGEQQLCTGITLG